MEGSILLRRTLCAALALLIFSALPALAAPADHLLRLHVVADSDSPAAQAIKLEVRDAVLELTQRLLARCTDADEAWDTLTAHLTDVWNASSARLAELGCDLSLSVQAGVFAFPDRDYGSVTLPAGDYRALRVIIGSGQGQNWWCVLYPNLCLPTDDGYNSVILDWLKKLLGGENP